MLCNASPENSRDVVRGLEEQRDDAERQASHAKKVARRLRAENLALVAREKGRKEGYEMGFGHGRRRWQGEGELRLRHRRRRRSSLQDPKSRQNHFNAVSLRHPRNMQLPHDVLPSDKLPLPNQTRNR
ncbi:hypothetical protein C8F01DRAFT_1187139 [Mycena amicta]|nr:hypothetical protein C8F01DRAFT_1187139 [Mycena amicta]